MKKIRATLLASLVSLAIFLAACKSTRFSDGILSNTPKAASTSSATGSIDSPQFPIAKITVQGNHLTIGSWEQSTDVFQGDHQRYVVVATWCVHSKDLLDKIGTKPELIKAFNAALIYDDEAPRLLRSMNRNPAEWGLSADQLKNINSNLQNKTIADNKLIVEHQFIPFYFIKKRQFDDFVDSVPTMISCTSESCKDMQNNTAKSKIN